MKRLAFVLTAVAALTLTACSGNNQDTLRNAELNQPTAEALDEQANQAALDAANAEAAALGSQQQALEEQNAAVEEATSPSDADEQNVSGM